jgi:uncharacterized protein
LLRTLISSTEYIGDGAMKNLIYYIAQALVDNPEQVTVSEVEGNQTSVIELKVAKEDLGKVIGKQGRTARAMRTILSAASAKVKKRTVLEIIE